MAAVMLQDQRGGAMSDESGKGAKKSYWGWGVAAVYTAFALSTLGFVALTMRHKVDLVSKDYYAREVAYERQIQRERETLAVEDRVACFVTDGGRFIKLSFPVEQGRVRGTLTLYRPSDSALDREIKLDVDASGAQLIPAGALAKGRWRAKVQWQAEGREFYKEFVLTI
jgi:hypothetical protein